MDTAARQKGAKPLSCWSGSSAAETA